MSSEFDSIRNAYQQLSSLYKNPTRTVELSRVDGIVAANINNELLAKYESLFAMFISQQRRLWQNDEALFYKCLALLYEIDDYRGVVSPVRNAIVEFCTTEKRIRIDGKTNTVKSLIDQFAEPPDDDGSTVFDRINPEDIEQKRSEVKAKIRCCVAAIESRRRDAKLTDLAHELDILERFIKKHLHQPPGLPAWTTLAFVLSAQARLARQAQNYNFSHQKLLEEVQCLDQRAAEIIDRLFYPEKIGVLSDRQIEDLKDDLMFIRRKQTLSSFFNVALAAFQRGFLKTANQACQSARLQFRLHGLFFQQVFNDLIILSIKRARTSRGQIENYHKLKHELETDIIPKLSPATGVAHPKLYLYSLRELAVLQYYCEETVQMLGTLDLMDELMEKNGPFSNQWKSRVSNQRARALWRSWFNHPGTGVPEAALHHAQQAFTFACGLSEKISEYHDATALRNAIERSKKTSLIDTIESLVTYGSIEASCKQFAEAIKSATAVIQLSNDENPRLCAMGYLVRAEAYAESDQILEAQRDVVQACEREARIDHCYVSDRRKFVVRAVERRLPPPSLFLGDMDQMDFNVKGKNRLLGWFIVTKTDKRNKSEVADKLGVSRARLESYLRYLRKNESDPYSYLVSMLSRRD